MLLRCTLDGLVLEAKRNKSETKLIAFDGDEPFEMERVEAVYYELMAATTDDLIWLEQAGYRMLRIALDFVRLPCELFV